VFAPAAAAQAPPTLLAAGDIASCVTFGDEATAAILEANPDGVVAPLGDLAYPNGTPTEFAQCYHPSWGRFFSRTRPAIGNHEYETPGAGGYWNYFGTLAGQPGQGWYSYELGSWHVVVLNSNCGIVGCHPGSEQEAWLRADLAASTAACTVAYWHHARFSSGRAVQLTGTEPLWAALYENGADLILAAHDHFYERHAPQTPIGDRRADFGIRQFVVGTGGHSHFPFLQPRLPSSEVANDDTFGVLEVTLRTGGYDWEFLPEAGRSFTDAGSGTCHGAPPDRTPPSAGLVSPAEGSIVRGPQRLAATASDNGTVSRVDFLVDRTVVATDDTAPYELTWNSGAVPDGRRVIVARAVDAYGNAAVSQASVVIDNALPDTTFTRVPAPDWRLRTATFAFTSEPGAAFECALDATAFAPCTSPVSLTNVKPGPHTFRVRARDAAGNLEPIPARHLWRVDQKAPATTILFSSTARGPRGEATFFFGSSETRSTFTCSVDGGPWQPCSSPTTLAGVAAGRHSFRVRAADAAGNVDWIPAVREWTVIRGATGLSIIGGPGDEVLVGTSGNDVIDGGGGDDEIDGLRGQDSLRGGSGADRLDGGSGNDRVFGDAGFDRLLGGAGRDVLHARDGGRDVVSGGPGRDRGFFDRRRDVVRGVERRS
jgi:Bacterial Ig domain/RTX calcium-binding nonapeptide repeat (4 copies)/Calcineurin-like phosphoesterase